MSRIIRVFPTKTHATPDDELVRIRITPSLFDEADEVHISVAFTWDIPWAEWAARQWKCVAPVKVGGPAYNEPGGEFIPGMYMKHGYVITSGGAQTAAGFVRFPNVKASSFANCPYATDGLLRMITCWLVLKTTLTRFSICSPGSPIVRSSSAG